MSVDLVFQFLGEQWLLVMALVATLTMLVLHEGRKSGPALSINEAVQLINVEGGVFLDIRDAGDFARGHITDALHIPAASLADRYAELEKFRDKPIVVVCKMGQSAGPATKTLRAQG
ncbi:MAG: rhodanese-like domain-containing protein, partial [Halieaceae bacterium]